MITWYDPKEKMPEVGDNVVVYDIIADCEPLELYKGIVKLTKDKGLIIGDIDFNFVQIEKYDRWAYAKDFNFPKAEK